MVDVAIVGAGPDGLAAAASLARDGASVLVLERRFERGGSYASDDFSTPFTFNLRRLLVPPAALVAVADLDLAGHGLTWTTPTPLVGDDVVAQRYAERVAPLDGSVLIGGGVKNLANALFRAAAAAGARCEVSAEVTAIDATPGGFRLTTLLGPTFEAARVLWTPTARTGEREPFVAHFGVKGDVDRDRPVIEVFGFADPADVAAALAAVARDEFPVRPCGHLTVTTVFDPLQASPGPFGPLHTVRVEALVPQRHPDGDWMRARRAYRRTVYEAVEHRLGDVTLLQEFCDTPDDLRQRFAPRSIALPPGVEIIA